MASLYAMDELFWDRGWVFNYTRRDVYDVCVDRTVICQRGPSWGFYGDVDVGPFPVRGPKNEFRAYTPTGGLHRRYMDLCELIDYLESTGRSWAVDKLQVFCEDASIGWPPDADMNLYLEQKASIWSSFKSRLDAVAGVRRTKIFVLKKDILVDVTGAVTGVAAACYVLLLEPCVFLISVLSASTGAELQYQAAEYLGPDTRLLVFAEPPTSDVIVAY